MNDNWHPSGATALVSVHQNQQLQPTATMEEQNHPHRPRTTPDWNIQNTVMKIETIEDRNNDSGVSPGHYETSPSPERRSSENRSYSPCSATSNESHPIPSGNYSYTMQENYQNGSMPIDYATSQSTPMSPRTQSNIDDQMDVVSSSMRTKRERPVPRTHRFEFECPICGFKTLERDVLWDHLTIHYNPNRLEDEPPVPRTVPIPGCTPEEITERIAKHEESINYPIINAQGKVKINRCKICKFRAITKVEFWRHIKTHTKVEKRLYCQYCPFVTDLKHHFEYHMNKQTGAKPFACKQCAYKCVNKSMLSSHMKSHTDVRQFSCAECAYVTKYCHSLKMHLRKYRHEPGPILNPDGTINLFTTIDVYGTRRGPKQKKPSAIKSANQAAKSTSTETQKMQNDIKASYDGPMPIALSPQNSSSNECQPMMMNPINMVNPFSGAGLNSMLAMQYNHMLRNGFPTTEPYANNDEATARNINQFRANFLAEFMMVAERMQSGAAPNNPQDLHNYYTTHSYMDVPQPVADISAQYSNERDHTPQNSLEVLDLSRPGNPTSNNTINSNNNSTGNIENRQICRPIINQHLNRSVASSSSSPRASGTSRRKGRAVKLNRRTMENDSDDGNQSEDNATERATPESYTSSENANEVNFRASEADNTVLLKCNFCPISFGSEAMYTIHMGYHGYNDPYTCNICGQRCEDALSFNVHLSRASHA